jgi:hypothetical protein
VIWSGEPQTLGQWRPVSRNGRSVLYRRAAPARPVAEN